MNLFNGLLRFVLANIRLHKLRSSLTILGMVFGTGAVLATLSSQEGAKHFVRAELAKLGTTTLRIEVLNKAEGVGSEERLLLEHYAQTAKGFAEVSEKKNIGIRRGGNVRESTLVGVDSPFFNTASLRLLRGRLFDEHDVVALRQVAVIGAKLARELFGLETPVGQVIHVFRDEIPIPFQVIGLLQEKGGEASGSVDSSLFVTKNWLLKWNSEVSPRNYLLAQVADESLIETAKREVNALLTSIPALRFSVSDSRETLEKMRTIWDKQNWVGLILASISLLTGGVGIMNIMLLSVSQRRKEIGLRKALGANDLQILFQFLFESMFMCLIGGLLGVGLGLWLGNKVALMLGHWSARLSPWTVLIALSFSLVTGLVFGLLPALRASKLEPYEALRGH